MLRVGDLDRSIKFYADMFGMKEICAAGTLRPASSPTPSSVTASEDTDTVLEFTYNYGVDKYDIGTALRPHRHRRAGRLRHLRAAARGGRQDHPRAGAGEARHHRDRVRRGPGRLQDRAGRGSLSRHAASVQLNGSDGGGAWAGARAPHRSYRRHRAGAGRQDGVADLCLPPICWLPAPGSATLAGADHAARRSRASAFRSRPPGPTALPRFDLASHLAALAADPPRWPARTGAVSLLALDLEIGWPGYAAALPPRRIRLEFLDYPGEWLLDLPLLGQDFSAWSEAVLRAAGAGGPRRATSWPSRAACRPTLRPTRRWPTPGTSSTGAALTPAARRPGLSLLQPGRFLMPAPGPAPPWIGLLPAARRRPPRRPAARPLRPLSCAGPSGPAGAVVRPHRPAGGAGRPADRAACRAGCRLPTRRRRSARSPQALRFRRQVPLLPILARRARAGAAWRHRPCRLRRQQGRPRRRPPARQPRGAGAHTDRPRRASPPAGFAVAVGPLHRGCGLDAGGPPGVGRARPGGGRGEGRRAPTPAKCRTACPMRRSGRIRSSRCRISSRCG